MNMIYLSFLEWKFLELTIRKGTDQEKNENNIYNLHVFIDISSPGRFVSSLTGGCGRGIPPRGEGRGRKGFRRIVSPSSRWRTRDLSWSPGRNGRPGVRMIAGWRSWQVENAVRRGWIPMRVKERSRRRRVRRNGKTRLPSRLLIGQPIGKASVKKDW